MLLLRNHLLGECVKYSLPWLIVAWRQMTIFHCVFLVMTTAVLILPEYSPPIRCMYDYDCGLQIRT